MRVFENVGSRELPFGGDGLLWTFCGLFADWEQAADSTVASMRSAAGRNTHDKSLTDLVGELVTRSDDFRLRWSAHNVRFHRAGVKRVHHPDVGDLEFSFEGLELPDRPGCVLLAYTTVAGSVTEERVKLLGSLAATRAAQSAAKSAAAPPAQTTTNT